MNLTSLKLITPGERKPKDRIYEVVINANEAVSIGYVMEAARVTRDQAKKALEEMEKNGTIKPVTKGSAPAANRRRTWEKANG